MKVNRDPEEKTLYINVRTAAACMRSPSWPGVRSLFLSVFLSTLACRSFAFSRIWTAHKLKLQVPGAKLRLASLATHSTWCVTWQDTSLGVCFFGFFWCGPANMLQIDPRLVGRNCAPGRPGRPCLEKDWLDKPDEDEEFVKVAVLCRIPCDHRCRCSGLKTEA